MTSYRPLNDHIRGQQRRKRFIARANVASNIWKSGNTIAKMIKTDKNKDETKKFDRDERNLKIRFAKDTTYNEAVTFVLTEIKATNKQVISIVKRRDDFELECSSPDMGKHIRDRIKALDNYKKGHVDIVEFIPINTKVTVHGVLRAFPDEPIQDMIANYIGVQPVECKAERESKGNFYNGMRSYLVNTEALRSKPLPEKIYFGENDEWRFLITYPNMVKNCFKCGESGHIRKDCTKEDEHYDNQNDIPDYSVRNVQKYHRDRISSVSSESSKRGRSPSGSNSDAKKIRDDGFDYELTPELNDGPWADAMTVELPDHVTGPTSAPRKDCVTCGNKMQTGLTPKGLVIARCSCSLANKTNIITKCIKKNCREWHIIPHSDKRIQCKRCESVKFICNCNILHSVDATDGQYKCHFCEECVDPRLLQDATT